MNNLTKIIYTILVFLSVTELSAQVCGSKELTTDPAAPVNKEKPSKINTFNWMQDAYKLNSAYVTFPLMYSPFSQPDNSLVDHLRISKDMYPKDGWELIKKDFGYKDDGSPATTPTGNPYLVLYNKYTATLRVFVAVGDRQAFNGAKIEVKFGSALQTSLLSQARPLVALDTYLKDPVIFSVSEFNNDYLKWFVADFPMTYDPCTCYFLSKVRIQVRLVDEADIKLSGTTTGKLVSINKGTGTVDNDKSVFSLGDLVEGAKKVNKSFKDGEEWVNNQRKAIEDKSGGSSTEKTEETKNLNLFQKLLKSSEFLRAGLSAVPYAYAALDLVEFFTAGGKKAEGPSEVKLLPMSIDMTSTFEGTIAATYLYRDILFWTPGSDNLTQDEMDYPYYNQTLGVFNLIESPSFYKRTFLPDCSQFETCYSEGPDGVPYPTECIHCQGMGSFYQISADRLKYVINPSSGLSIQDIQLAIVMEHDGKVADIIIKSNFEVEQYTSTGRPLIYRTPYFPLSQFNNLVFHNVGKNHQCRVLVNLRRKDTDEAQNVLMLFTYPLKYIGETTSYFGTEGVTLAPSQPVPDEIPFVNFINNVTFSTPTTVYGLDRIVIGKNVTIDPGVEVYFEASKEIVIEPGAELPAGAILKTGSLADSWSNLLPVSNSEVYSFCQSDKYKTTQRGFGLRLGITNESEDREISTTLYPAYPNPSNQETKFSYFIAESGPVKLYITNVLGIKIDELVNEANHTSGHFEKNWNIDSISEGMYFYTLETNTYKQTKKIIVIK